MRITLTTPSGEFAQINVDASTTIELVKLAAEAELRIPAASQVVTFKGQTLSDSQTLQQAGIQDDDMLLVGVSASGSPSLENIPPELFRNPQALQQYIKSNPALLQQLLHANPTMAEAVLAPDHHMLEAYLVQQASQRQQRQLQEMKEIEALNADPFNPQNQEKIAEIIRRQRVQENMEKAIEFNPESFGRVVMLYVPCRVNGAEVTAFVDSGAQSTIMSQECAARCGLMKWLDERFAGTAKGVGTAKILGRIHAAHVNMGKAHFQCSITVIQNQDMDFLFGLDQLKRHQACIDLKDNCLRIVGESIPFLSEKDLPAHIRSEDGSSAKPSPLPASTSSSSSSSSSPAPLPTVSPSIPNSTAGAASAARSLANPNRPVGAASTSGILASLSASQAPPLFPSPSPVPSRPQAQSQMRAPAAATFPEDKVQRLVALGFARPQVLQALQVFNGDEERAASYLVQNQFGF